MMNEETEVNILDAKILDLKSEEIGKWKSETELSMMIQIFLHFLIQNDERKASVLQFWN